MEFEDNDDDYIEDYVRCATFEEDWQSTYDDIIGHVSEDSTYQVDILHDQSYHAFASEIAHVFGR